MLQKTENNSIRSTAIWIQPICVTSRESVIQLQVDAESNRSSNSEAIMNYEYMMKQIIKTYQIICQPLI